MHDIINDISIGGIGIYTDFIENLQKDDEAFVKFELNEKLIKAKGIIIYTIENV
ncbi:PilZ domain-containing protein [Nitrosophilus labii]|uniref:PilZ domain-containing protein n=1 Tax=Nitrosophilus labii TaxID=2706014 RepID=UPI00351F16CB